MKPTLTAAQRDWLKILIRDKYYPKLDNNWKSFEALVRKGLAKHTPLGSYEPTEAGRNHLK